MRLFSGLMMMALAAAPAATAQTPNGWRSLDAGEQIVGWGDLEAKGLVVEGRRFILSKTPKSSFMGDVSWMVTDITLNCLNDTFTQREGAYLALDGRPVGKMNARPTQPIEAGSLEDLMRIAICEGRPIAGERIHASRDESMAAARAVAAGGGSQ